MKDRWPGLDQTCNSVLWTRFFHACAIRGILCSWRFIRPVKNVSINENRDHWESIGLMDNCVARAFCAVTLIATITLSASVAAAGAGGHVPQPRPTLPCGSVAPSVVAQNTSPVLSGLDTSGTSFGMGFVFWKLDMQNLPICSQRSNATYRGDATLFHYDDPQKRAAVVQELRQMHASGFSALRTFLFFSATRGPDWYKIGDDNEKAGTALMHYAQDVRDAGFSLLEINFAAEGSVDPTCREGGAWGACYDAGTTDSTIAFMIAVRRTMGPRTPLPMRFDLALGDCAPADLPEPLQSNKRDFASRVVSAYVGSFPNDQTTVSCPARRFPGGKASIDAAYSAVGRAGPNYYEIFLYRSDNPNRPQPISDAVEGVRHAMRGSSVPLELGETSYGDQDLVREIVDGLRGSGLRTVFFWPIMSNPGDKCQADVPPPWTLRAALGAN